MDVLSNIRLLRLWADPRHGCLVRRCAYHDIVRQPRTSRMDGLESIVPIVEVLGVKTQPIFLLGNLATRVGSS